MPASWNRGRCARSASAFHSGSDRMDQRRRVHRRRSPCGSRGDFRRLNSRRGCAPSRNASSSSTLCPPACAACAVQAPNSWRRSRRNRTSCRYCGSSRADHPGVAAAAPCPPLGEVDRGAHEDSVFRRERDISKSAQPNPLDWPDTAAFGRISASIPMNIEKIKVRITESGKTMDVVVLNKHAHRHPGRAGRRRAQRQVRAHSTPPNRGGRSRARRSGARSATSAVPRTCRRISTGSIRHQKNRGRLGDESGDRYTDFKIDSGHLRRTIGSLWPARCDQT